jgi:hypothetical protein
MRNPFANGYYHVGAKASSYLLECSDLWISPRIYKAILHVIHCCAARSTLKPAIWSLLDTSVGTIRSFEIHHGRPVVGEVLCKLTCRTSRLIRVSFLRVHECFERVLHSSAGSIFYDLEDRLLRQSGEDVETAKLPGGLRDLDAQQLAVSIGIESRQRLVLQAPVQRWSSTASWRDCVNGDKMKNREWWARHIYISSRPR